MVKEARGIGGDLKACADLFLLSLSSVPATDGLHRGMGHGIDLCEFLGLFNDLYCMAGGCT